MLTITGNDYLHNIKKGDTAVIVEVLKVQPPDGYVIATDTPLEWINDKDKYAFFTSENEPHKQMKIKLQNQKGETVGIKEVWCSEPTFGEYFYKSDYGINDESWAFKWNSPATLPHEAIRDFRTVTGNRVCRVQDVTIEEIIKIGIFGLTGFCDAISTKPLVDWFNSIYAKPRPRRKNGEIVGWECWCWDMDSWLTQKNIKLFLVTNENWDKNVPLWKGKPLTIHANCWVEVIRLEK